MSKDKVFVISNSHIDPVWLWDKYEGIDEVINTFRSACDRLDEYPQLKFSASSICFYSWVETFAPDVFERIKAHVASGRWEIVGGWWVETDCNLPSGESFRKSAEISKSYVWQRFGVDVPVAYSPDAFGHAASLPELLADTGFKYYIFCRPDEAEKSDLPGNLFYWEHGGKRVLCYRLKYHYTMGLEWDTRRVDEALSDKEFVKDGIACYFFGLGDHGGGPTKAEIEYMLRRKSEISDRIMAFSTCLEFFREAEKLPDIPVYSGDMHNHAVGCYSVNRALKQAVRDAENALCYTERVLDAAGDCPQELSPLWRKTLFNQFHDILPGSCSPNAVSQALAELGAVQADCCDISYKALKRISSSLPVKCPQGEFRIFNSLSEPVTGPLEIESFMYFRPGSPFQDSSGRAIPVQEITPSVNCLNRRWLFLDTIPAKTVKSYRFQSKDAPPVHQDVGIFYEIGDEIAAGGFKVESPGRICSADSLAPFLALPIRLGIVDDQSDTWSHGISGYGPSDGYFQQESCAVHNGSIASFLISRQTYGNSWAELKYTVYKTLPYVDMDITLHWMHRRSVLKLEINLACALESVVVQGPGSAIVKRKSGSEEPLHGWILAGDLGLLQTGAFSFDYLGDKLRITLVRSSLYGYDRHWRIDPLGPVNHTDIGEHKFRLRFLAESSDRDCSEMDKLLLAFREPFQVMRDNK